MGQIKNIKLHIVTDIKVCPLSYISHIIGAEADNKYKNIT